MSLLLPIPGTTWLPSRPYRRANADAPVAGHVPGDDPQSQDTQSSPEGVVNGASDATLKCGYLTMVVYTTLTMVDITHLNDTILLTCIYI